MPDAPRPPGALRRYHLLSRSGYYGAIAALPLLLAYEALLWGSATPAPYQVRNAADVWLRTLMASLGATPRQASLAMLLLVILAVPLLRRGRPLVPRYFAWVLVESALYSAALFVLSAMIPPLPAAMPGGVGLEEGVALSLGAGLFEELAFRVVLVTVLLWAGRWVFAPWLAVLAAVLGAAFLFALAHYVGPLGEPFSAGSFLFRWAAGLVFTLLYTTRGFAVTATTHALYDLWVLLA